MSVEPIKGKNAGLALWFCSGQTMTVTVITTMLYQATARAAGRVRRHHTQMAMTSCSGLSQIQRELGLVASWLEKHTRNVTTHPAMPRSEKKRVYHHLLTRLRRAS